MLLSDSNCQVHCKKLLQHCCGQFAPLHAFTAASKIKALSWQVLQVRLLHQLVVYVCINGILVGRCAFQCQLRSTAQYSSTICIFLCSHWWAHQLGLKLLRGGVVGSCGSCNKQQHYNLARKQLWHASCTMLHGAVAMQHMWI
jgi:hypothetical protein